MVPEAGREADAADYMRFWWAITAEFAPALYALDVPPHPAALALASSGESNRAGRAVVPDTPGLAKAAP